MNTITITEEEQKVLKKALDLYSRILCGQFEEISNMAMFGKLLPTSIYLTTTKDDFYNAENYLCKAKQKLFGLSPHESYSILNEAIRPEAKIAYDLINKL